MRPVVVIANLIVLGLALSAFGCSGNVTTGSNQTNTANPTSANVEETPTGGSAESQSAAVVAVVTDLYKQHDAKKSPFFQTKDRSIVDKYFTKQLADLIWKESNNTSGEVGAIDGDPLYNAQDIEIKNFSIGRADVNGDVAKLPVTFSNFGQKSTVTFSLKTVNGSWKINDIKYSENDSLLKWLKETYTGKPASRNIVGEFDGKFQVGDTTCTVRPIKMAFEVRWAKGSGVEIFYFVEGYTFESSPDEGGNNRFEFDDENYTTGTFYRTDGKTFPIKRAK